jgi:hypothetical protein
MRTVTLVSNAGDGALAFERRARTAFWTCATVFADGASSSLAALSVIPKTGIGSVKKRGMYE